MLPNLSQKKKNNQNAAIASELASDIYDLKISKRNIEDNKNNVTRFLVFSRKQLEVDQVKRFAADQHRKGKFLTKVDSIKAMQIFTSMKIVNSETIDAALLIPEII